MYLLIALLASLWILARVEADQYCAYFNPATANGVSGYFAMQIENGAASYAYDIDLTSFTGLSSCSAISAYGMQYHIHTYWNNRTATSTAGSANCGNPIGGGHYDPYLACGPFSQNIRTSCLSLRRTAAYNYTYTCTESLFNSGNYSLCEVGDFSGKFGDAYATGSSLVFQRDEFVDYLPPLVSNYNSNQPTSLMWQGIIFHCGLASGSPASYTRLFCAQFTQNLSPCATAFESFANNSIGNLTADYFVSDSADDDKYDGYLRPGYVVLIAVLSWAFGACLAAAIVYCLMRSPQSKGPGKSQNEESAGMVVASSVQSEL